MREVQCPTCGEHVPVPAPRLPRCECSHSQAEHRGPQEPRSGRNAVPPCTTAAPRPCGCTGWTPAVES